MTEPASDIHEAQHRVMEAVGYVQKQKPKGMSYSVVLDPDVVRALRDSMLEQQIVMWPVGCQPESLPAADGAKSYRVRCKYTFRFYHVPSKTSADCEIASDGWDGQDKASAKATTMARKYSLLTFFLIESGEDPALVYDTRADPNADWVRKAIGKIEGCRDEKALDALVVRMRGRDEKTNEPYFTEEQLPEIVMYSERHRIKLRTLNEAKGDE